MPVLLSLWTDESFVGRCIASLFKLIDDKQDTISLAAIRAFKQLDDEALYSQRARLKSQVIHGGFRVREAALDALSHLIVSKDPKTQLNVNELNDVSYKNAAKVILREIGDMCASNPVNGSTLNQMRFFLNRDGHDNKGHNIHDTKLRIEL